MKDSQATGFNLHSSFSKWEVVVVVLLLVMAAVWRVGWAGVNSFSFDEARVSQLALEMAREGKFAALGMQSSTGVPNFPAAVWLFAIPYAISVDPWVATLWVGVANVAAVALFWWLARTAWGRGAGVAALLIMGFAPFNVFYARNIWGQNWLIPVAVAWAVTAVLALRQPAGRGRDWFLGLHAFLAGFAFQVHLAGLCLVLPSLWLGVRYQLWGRWRPIVAGGVVALICAAPTLYIIGRYGAGAQAQLGNILGNERALSGASLRQLGELVTHTGWEWFWLNGDWAWGGVLGAGLLFGRWLTGGLVAVGLGMCVWIATRKAAMGTAAHILGTLIPVWALSAPLLFLSSKTPVYHQYQLAAVPALWLAAAAVGGWQNRVGQAAVLVGLSVMAMAHSAALWQTLDISGRELVQGGMGTPLRYPQAAVRQLEADGRPVVVHSVGAEIAYDGDAAVFNVLLWGSPHQIVDGRFVLLVPAVPAHLVATFESVPAWQMAEQLGLVAQGSVRQWPRRLYEPPYMGLDLDSVDWEALFPPLAEESALVNGAILRGWRAEEMADGRWQLITHWELTQPAGGETFQQFNHLYVAGEDAPAQVQDVTLSAHAWQAGDHLVTWVVFDAPPVAPERFEIGMYTWPALVRSAVVGQAGGSGAIVLRP